MPDLVGAGLSVIRQPAISVDIITKEAELGVTDVGGMPLPEFGPWDISAFSYGGIFRDVAVSTTKPSGVFISSDGSKMYISDGTTQKVYEWDLGTPFVLSTATYSSVSANTTEGAAAQDLFFKPDGTQMFVCNSGSDGIYMYNLATPWSLATSSYGSKTFNPVTQETTTIGLFFRDDGLRMYIVGYFTATVWEYVLSTAWDVSTSSYSGKSFSAASQDTRPTGVHFKDDGTKMYVVGETSDAIFEYDLSTAWDVTTAVYNGKFLNVLPETANPSGVYFKLDGTTLYVPRKGSPDKIFQYDI